MRTLLLALAVAGAASPLAAQSAEVAGASSAAAPHPSYDARLLAPAFSRPAEPFTLPVAVRAPRAGGISPAVRLLGGAVIGGWVGYIASQVSRSDWDKEEDGEFTSYRLSFAGGGAVLGAVAGLVMGRTSGGTVGPAAARTEDPTSRGGETITMEEVRASPARNAAELVQALRPLWLQTRGTSTFRENTRGEGVGAGGAATVRVTEQGTGGIRVYMDNALLGDVGSLRQIPLGAFAQVRFYDAAAATYRWGAGHGSGVIQLVTGGEGQPAQP